jgi:UDP-N-acetylglucosamine--N-acetylmuramyl-(pentapeptide) pyrophosphoryl-undecaprenol N-acetylglucosamine transferase
MTDEHVFAVITGGGTAGHVLPALAIAEALVARGHTIDELHYVGARRGLETRLLPPTGISHSFLDVIGLQRSFSRRNLGFAPKLFTATRAARQLLRRLRPRVVVSVGGYASLPSVLAARRLRIPIVVVSYDKRPGQSSKLAARFAAACAVAFLDSPLPRARLTGAPLRQAIVDLDRTAARPHAREQLGLPSDRFVVAVTGGSQGSGVLNAAVTAVVERWSSRTDVAVRHVVGERFVQDASPARDGSSGILYQVIGYEDQMPLVYAAADVLVGRGGASTVTEVAATGVPAILVPWAGAAEDHQTDNVRWLSDQGAAVLVPESELDGDRLIAELERLASDAEALTELGRRAHTAGAVHRSSRLAELIEEVARR